MQKISVIGGSGFIGTRLCKRLKGSNRDFFIIDKKVSQTFPEETTVVDVREIEGLRKAIKGDVIVNFAAEHRDDVRPKSLYWEVNVKGAENVCKVAEEKGIDKIIFTSSVAVYGFTEKETFEDGELRPFNDYGITKLEAEKVYINWQKKDPKRRTLVIIRPTVVFGEGNRGNVYNLLKQIASGRFVIVGNGKNIKSMAYVENVAAFIEYSMTFPPGIHIYNYVDKPDFDMNTLVSTISSYLQTPFSTSEVSTPEVSTSEVSTSEVEQMVKKFIRIPYSVGLLAGKIFDLIAFITRKKLPISSVRIKKFCSNTQFGTSVPKTGFIPPVTLYEGLKRTIRHEFLEPDPNAPIFYTE
ncbi:MAG: NAD(P)-dependent oxidoreductase [candidate division WOR-3 bacterium]